MTPCPDVCPFKTFPCVHSKRPRVCVQNVPVCTGTTRTCFNTCARGAGIHGDVLNVHTGTFLKPNTDFSKFLHRLSTHRNTHTKHTTQHNTQHHTETDRERETRQDKTRQDDRGETEKERQRREERREKRDKMKKKIEERR